MFLIKTPRNTGGNRLKGIGVLTANSQYSPCHLRQKYIIINIPGTNNLKILADIGQTPVCGELLIRLLSVPHQPRYAELVYLWTQQNYAAETGLAVTRTRMVNIVIDGWKVRMVRCNNLAPNSGLRV